MVAHYVINSGYSGISFIDEKVEGMYNRPLFASSEGGRVASWANENWAQWHFVAVF